MKRASFMTGMNKHVDPSVQLPVQPGLMEPTHFPHPDTHSDPFFTEFLLFDCPSYFLMCYYWSAARPISSLDCLFEILLTVRVSVSWSVVFCHLLKVSRIMERKIQKRGLGHMSKMCGAYFGCRQRCQGRSTAQT